MDKKFNEYFHKKILEQKQELEDFKKILNHQKEEFIRSQGRKLEFEKHEILSKIYYNSSEKLIEEINSRRKFFLERIFKKIGKVSSRVLDKKYKERIEEKLIPEICKIIPYFK